jgi:hypothetical protein
MSEREKLRKALTDRDVARMRLKKARGALYRIIRLTTDDRIRRIAKGGCGQTKKRKAYSLPGQIDLEEWINEHRV